MFGQPAGTAILRGKNLKVGHDRQTIQPDVFKPAVLISTIDFYHFILSSLTFTLPGGHKVAQSKTYWLHFLPHFSADQDEM